MGLKLHEIVRREYTHLAPLYDLVWRRYVATTTERTLECLRPNGAERVLDVGCGTGQLLEALSAACPEAELHGVDLTPRMLRKASERLGPAANLRVASAEQLPYEDAYFDVVLSTSVFHCLGSRQRAALAEWRRVTRPGGMVALTDWSADHLATRAHLVGLKLIGRRHYAPRTPDQLAESFADAGLEVTSRYAYRAGTWGVVTVCARRPEG